MNTVYKCTFFLALMIFPGLNKAWSQEQVSGFDFSLGGLGLVSSGSNNPFWMYSNQYGRQDAETHALALVQAGYTFQLGGENSLKLGGGLLANDGIYEDVRADELYVAYTNTWLQASAGLKHRDEKLSGISSVGGDVVWSNNARALPGIYVEMLKPFPVFKWFEVKATFGHYFLEQARYVSNAQVHHKSVELALVFGNGDRLSGTLKHYVQYGGTSPQYGKQPSAFGDYIRVFFGSSGSETAFAGDQINVLGNALGSQEVAYEMKRDKFDLRFYHQNIFEDGSGMMLKNFPDGVWGAYIEPKKIPWLDAFVVEYVQTVSQSGRFGNSGNGGNFNGGDSYFWNGIYQTGWSYQDRIIGLPFIIPGAYGQRNVNDRSFVYHLGATGSISSWSYKAKLSAVTNLGTYNTPYQPKEQVFYAYGELGYTTSFGLFTGYLGADLSNRTRDLLGAGLGYKYWFK